MKTKRLIVANWKMNPLSLKEAVILARGSDEPRVVICPPFVFLDAVSKALVKAALGVQDVFWKAEGAYTGEVSPVQARRLGALYAIIGHSERRQNLYETDAMVGEKTIAADRAGLIPILCVGETKNERDRGQAKAVVARELDVTPKGLKRFIVAYEPLWAISTAKQARVDSSEDTLLMIKFIRERLRHKVQSQNLQILYGGSVNSRDVEKFLPYEEIAGFLVGGASLRAGEFKKIIKKIQHYES